MIHFVKSNQKTPHALVVGEPQDHKQASLVTDNRIVCEVPPSNIPLYLLACFYVFNICYPHGCSNFYSF